MTIFWKDDWTHPKLGGGFKKCSIFTPKIGEDSHFDEQVSFQRGWFNHQLAKRSQYKKPENYQSGRKVAYSDC